jgi:ABC-type glycerol-3-phosphate transport system substrate-binding protein
MLKRTVFAGLVILALIAAFPVWSQNKANVKGMEIVIGNWWADYDVNTRKPQNESEEKELEQRKKLMQENGVIIREKAVSDWNGMQQKAVISTMSGKPDAQVLYLQPDWAMAMRARGLLAALPASIKKPTPIGRGYAAVEFQQPTIDSFTFGGKSYAFSIGVNYNNFQALFFNKRLFREAGLDPNLPYDMQKAGTWTWAAFTDICKKLTRDTNNDGKMDTYAMCADPYAEMVEAVISSNGATYVDKDRNGKFVNATNKPEFLEALQYLINLEGQNVLKPRPENANWDWYKSEFIDGKVAMRIDESYVGASDNAELTKMKDDWGMVLFPKGPKARNNNYCVYTRDTLMVIPNVSTYKPADIDKIMWAVALWFTPSDTNWKARYYSYYRDARAVDETLALVRDPKLAMIKYHTYINGLERGDIAWHVNGHKGDPAQIVEAVSQDWNAKIAEANK